MTSVKEILVINSLKKERKMKDSFSISRFWLLLKKDFVENKTALVIGSFALFAAMSLLMIILSIFIDSPDKGGCIIGYVLEYLFGIGCAISVSLSFSPMRTKQGRISMFTLPATTLEKYLEQIVVYIFGFAAVYAICVELGELVRCVIAPLVWGKESIGIYINHFAVLGTMKDAFNDIHLVEMGITGSKIFTICVLGVIADLGIFTLGAVLWPKFSFIKTYAATYVIGIVFFIAFIVVASVVDITEPMIETLVSELLIVIIVLQVLIAVAAFVAGYYLLKRKNVIHPTVF